MKKHQEHIVCIKSSKVQHRAHGFVEYEPVVQDIMLGQRAVLEHDQDFRQIIPVSVFTHQGKIWAYERTSAGGEARLHNKVAVAVGGHWDISDIVFTNGVIDLQASMQKAMDRELTEELALSSGITRSHLHPKMICADDTDVERVHMAMIWFNELDGTGIEPREIELKSLGFYYPKELLASGLNLEPWARIICQMLSAAEE